MKKKYYVIAAVVVVVASATAWYFLRPKPARMRERTVKKDSITLKILATGSVQPENRLQIKSPIAGRAEEVLVVEGQKVAKGQVLAIISSTERAVMLDSARSEGPEEVKKWEEIYRPTPILAPLPGTIILRGIEPGQTFTTSDAIFVMADRLSVKAQVDETDLAQIHVNQKAQIVLDAYLDRVLDAKVSQVAYEAKTTNNVTTYTIDVIPLDKSDFFRSGMTANVTFYGETKDEVPVIPNEFIKYENGDPKVDVKTESGKTETRDLKLGITDGRVTEVLSGVEAGETMVQAAVKDNKAKSNIMFSGGAGAGGAGRRR